MEKTGFGVIAMVLCNEKNFDSRGKELRCVAEAGHLDDRKGHVFKYVDPADEPEPYREPSHYAIGAQGMGWRT